MKLYRVLTENVNYQNITDYLDKHFPDGYTIIAANGAWQGKREKSLVIEIVGEDVIGVNDVPQNAAIGKLVFWLKKHNGQESVLVQAMNAEISFL